MEGKYHILIMPSWYPLRAGDIGGSFFREQAIALRKAGNKVGVIFPVVRSVKDIGGLINKPYGLQTEDDDGVMTLRYYYLNIAIRMPKIGREIWLKHGKYLFNEYVKLHGKPDIIHVHSLLPAGYLAHKINSLHNIPYVVTEHSTAYARKQVDEDTLNSLIPVINGSSKNISVSREFKSLLDQIFNTNSWSFLPNIVNDGFLNYPLSPANQEDKTTLINVCFLTKKKRVDLLIKAFSTAFKGNLNIQLKIGGDGEEKESLIALSRELGIENQVCYLGALTRDQVKQEISKSDAFVLSSEYETFGVVLVEALALGKPVIATKCGGPESIVVPEVGYLVEKNSVNELASALNDFVMNRESFNADSIREYCRNNFSEEAVVRKLEQIYSAVLK